MSSRPRAAAAAVLLSFGAIALGATGPAAAGPAPQAQVQPGQELRLIAPLQVAQVRPAAAAVPEAGHFIAGLADQAIAGLADQSLTAEQRIQRFRTLLTTDFDMPAIARFVLGRYWRVATPQERDEYVKLFEEYVVQIYASRFQDYNGEKLKVDSAWRDDDGAVVTTSIVRQSGPPVKVDWKLRGSAPAFKIVDVMVEGVSMSVTQRDDFAAAIQAHGGRVAGLIDMLRQKIQTAQK